MAKIKLKYGENEIEIESRDFYVDNESIGEVIENITNHLEENKAKFVYDDNPPKKIEKSEINYQASINYLKSLDNAEVHEPEYQSPIPIFDEEIIDKIYFLNRKSFFNKPRTVSEVVSQLREFGWSASPLHVSKALAKLAFNKKIQKNSYQNRCYYCANKELLAN